LRVRNSQFSRLVTYSKKFPKPQGKSSRTSAISGADLLERWPSVREPTAGRRGGTLLERPQKKRRPEKNLRAPFISSSYSLPSYPKIELEVETNTSNNTV